MHELSDDSLKLPNQIFNLNVKATSNLSLL